MKKTICIFAILIIAVLLVVFLFAKNNDAIKFKKEYEEFNNKTSSSGKEYPKLEIPKNNPIKYKTAEELVEIIKNGTGAIYFGFPNCPWCRSAIPALLEAAEQADIKNIYYLNVKEIRDIKQIDDSGKIIEEKEGSSGYKNLLEFLDKYLDDYILEDNNGKKVNTNEKRIFVPLVVFVKNGKIEGVHADTVKSQKDPYIKLNDTQKEELTLIYYKLMIKIGDDSCDESC